MQLLDALMQTQGIYIPPMIDVGGKTAVQARGHDDEGRIVIATTTHDGRTHTGMYIYTNDVITEMTSEETP